LLSLKSKFVLIKLSFKMVSNFKLVASKQF